MRKVIVCAASLTILAALAGAAAPPPQQVELFGGCKLGVRPGVEGRKTKVSPLAGTLALWARSAGAQFRASRLALHQPPVAIRR
jgi:hypothetical protein